MIIDIIEVYRTEDDERLGYLAFSYESHRLYYTVNEYCKDIGFAYDYLKEATNDVRGKLADNTISDSLETIAERLSRIRLSSGQPDNQIHGKVGQARTKDVYLKRIRDSLRTNQYDPEQLIGKTFEVQERINCKECFLTHIYSLPVKVLKAKDKTAVGESGSCVVTCPKKHVEYKVIWNTAKMNVVHVENLQR